MTATKNERSSDAKGRTSKTLFWNAAMKTANALSGQQRGSYCIAFVPECNMSSLLTTTIHHWRARRTRGQQWQYMRYPLVVVV
jgi:hypothetical protein